MEYLEMEIERFHVKWNVCNVSFLITEDQVTPALEPQVIFRVWVPA